MAIALDKCAILVIDDFEAMRGMLKDFLKARGCTNLTSAAHGVDALAAMARTRFDVVLCDYNLGKGKNGQQILEEAKYKKLIGYSTVWVIVTAEKTMDMVVAAAEYQPDDYLLKPFNQALLVTRLEKLLIRKGMFAKVDAALERNDHLKALSQCDELLAEAKGNTHELLKLKSNIYLSIGDYDAAREVYEQVMAERPVPWAKTGLGKILFKNRDYEGARVLFDEVARDNATYLDAHDWLGRTLEQLGETKQAQEVLQQAAKLSPNSMSRQQKIGELAHRNQDLEAADAAYARAIHLSENSVFRSASLLTERAKVLMDRNDTGEAIRLLESTRKEFRDQPEAQLRAATLQARVYQETGQADKAEAALQEMKTHMAAMGGSVPPEVSLDMSRVLLTAGMKDMAMEVLGQVVKNNVDNTQVIGAVRQFFDGENMGQEGGALIEASLSEVVRINDQGVMLAREGRIDEGVELLRQAHAALPENTRFLLNLAAMLITKMQQSGNNRESWQEAQACLEKVRQIDPSKPKLLEYLRVLDGLRA